MRLPLNKLPILALIALSLVNGTLVAGQPVALKLEAIEKVQQQEKGGDELYLNITEFTAGKRPVYYQIPAYPTHWLSKYLKNVKDVMLWKKTDNKCTNTDIVISLVEEDFAPWNLDDELGSVRLKVKCDKGIYKTEWVVPDNKNTVKLLNATNAFSFNGDSAGYRLQFKIEEANPLLQSIPQKIEHTLPLK